MIDAALFTFSPVGLIEMVATLNAGPNPEPGSLSVGRSPSGGSLEQGAAGGSSAAADEPMPDARQEEKELNITSGVSRLGDSAHVLLGSMSNYVANNPGGLNTLTPSAGLVAIGQANEP